MKKFTLFCLCLIPFSAFAGPDTDRVCVDSTKHDMIYDEYSFTVSYPGEKASVSGLAKEYKVDDPNDANMDRTGYYALYYMVNVGEGSKKRAELYTYNCSTKKPKLLLSVQMDPKKNTRYSLVLIDNMNLVLAETDPGYGPGPIETIIGYNFYTNKKLFTYIDKNDIFGEGVIEGFVAGNNAWYITYRNVGQGISKYNMNEVLYKIDKKTLKPIKL